MKFLKIFLLTIIMTTKICVSSTEELTAAKSFNGLSWVWSNG